MSDTSLTLSASEMKTLAAAWISCKEPPKPDYEIIAQICGNKTAASAQVIFGRIRRKLQGATVAPTIEGDDSSAKPATKVKRSANATDGEGPTKKRGRPSKKSTKDSEEDTIKAEAAEDNVKEENADELVDAKAAQANGDEE